MIKKYKFTSTKSYVCNKTNKEKEKKELNQNRHILVKLQTRYQGKGKAN